MARLPRIVIPNQPLHIMHRGNNRQDIFESEEDMTRIKEDIAHALSKLDVESPKGTAPSGAHRTGLERLRSSGSYRPVVAYSNFQCANKVGCEVATLNRTHNLRYLKSN